MRRLQFSPEIRLGDLVATVGVITGGFLAWSNINVELAIVKSAIASQVETSKEIRRDVRDLKQDVKDQGQTLRAVEDRVNRARL